MYYFDAALSEEDVAFVLESLEITGPCEQIRIPHVLPADTPNWTEKTFHKHQALLCGALRNAGIATDRGKQVILVAPGKMYWYKSPAARSLHRNRRLSLASPDKGTARCHWQSRRDEDSGYSRLDGPAIVRPWPDKSWNARAIVSI